VHIVDLVDYIRQMIMMKFERTISNNLQGVIISNVLKELNVISRNTRNAIIYRGGDNCAEVTEVDLEGKGWRYVVELDKQK
jgi:rRNA-processing protein FCF1